MDTLERFRLSDEQRTRRLTDLRLNEPGGEAAFDNVARLAASIAQAPLAMVNFINADQQMFRGMYVPTASPDDVVDVDLSAIPIDLGQLSRVAPVTVRGEDGTLDHFGFCPHVVAERSQLALNDVFDYPRFKGNALVNALNVRTYLGTPLIDNTGMILGTVCVAGFEPRQWDDRVKQSMKELVKTMLSEFKLRSSLLAQQEDLFGVFDVAPFPIMLTEGRDHRLRYANREQGTAFGRVPQFSPARQALPILEAPGVYKAMDEALRQGQTTTLRPVPLTTFDSRTTQYFSFMCTPVRTSPDAPFTGVLTVAMNTPGQAAQSQAFAAYAQNHFEQGGSGAFHNQ